MDAYRGNRMDGKREPVEKRWGDYEDLMSGIAGKGIE